MVFPEIVSENQSTFVSSRLIIDNALIALKLFNSIKYSNAMRGVMALRLDMTKAYDWVDVHNLYMLFILLFDHILSVY